MSGPYPPSPGSPAPGPAWPGSGGQAAPPTAPPTSLPPAVGPQAPPPPPPPGPGGSGGFGGPGGWPPQGPPPAPPGGGYGGWSPQGPPPGNTGRWKLFLALAVVLVLVGGLGVGGWAYATGRLGFGPLSAADKDAAATIAGSVEGPAWADEDQLRCAADDLVAERRSSGLAEDGLIESDDSADDGWSYTGDWSSDDADTFLTAVLDCSDDWEDQVGEEWGLDDTECLGDVGEDDVAAYLAVDVLGLDSDGARSASERATGELDDCYATDVSAPQGDATSSYRAVLFTFDEVDVPNASTTVSVRYDGDTKQLTGSTFRARTEEGGAEACVTTTVLATYAWGTTRDAETESCGTAEPKEIVWRKLKTCTVTGQGACHSWVLRYSGFTSLTTVRTVLQQNGGDCASDSGVCTFTTTAPATGRGVLVTWTAPQDWHERFEAKVGDLTAVLPN